VAPSTVTRQVTALIFLGIGAPAWILLNLTDEPVTQIGWRRWTVVIGAIAVALLPPVTRRIAALLETIRHPSRRATGRAAYAIAFAATAYFVFTALHQDRDLFAKTHDDQSYLIQMQMLARGRLWMPQHPLADFFDTFYVLVRPKYASLYFPGAALLYVPTIWLHLPTWVMPALVAGAIVGLVYRIVTELIDGVAGALAAVMLASLNWFRIFSILLTSHEPMLLLGLLLVWAWLRWRRRYWWGWALAMGVFGGWGAITRPADAVCFALPVACGILLDFFKRRSAGDSTLADRSEQHAAQPPTPQDNRPGWRAIAMTAVMLVAGAAPFLTLQLVFDKGVTGSYLRTPYSLYLDSEQPNTSIGFHRYDPAARPTSSLQQKQDYYDLFFAPRLRDHRPGMVLSNWGRHYFPLMVGTTLPARALLPFVAVGVLGLTCRRRMAMVAVLPLFVALYMLNPSFLEHYALVAVPAVLVCVLLGEQAVEVAWPRLAGMIAPAFVAGLLSLCVCTLPEFNTLWGAPYAVSDETFPSPLLRKLHEMDSVSEGPSAVVLFHYTKRPENPFAWINREPVYNTSVAWPDDALVVRAHDLGPIKNREIIDYYARLQPDRVFYRMDLATGLFEEMGTARELARKP
jgi:hypothetical protein